MTLFVLCPVTGLPRWLSSEGPACQCRRCGRLEFDSRVGKIPEKGMAAHSSVLAWETLWTEEPGGPQFMGSQGLEVTEHTHTWYTSSFVPLLMIFVSSHD